MQSIKKNRERTKRIDPEKPEFAGSQSDPCRNHLRSDCMSVAHMYMLFENTNTLPAGQSCYSLSQRGTQLSLRGWGVGVLSLVVTRSFKVDDHKILDILRESIEWMGGHTEIDCPWEKNNIGSQKHSIGTAAPFESPTMNETFTLINRLVVKLI